MASHVQLSPLEASFLTIERHGLPMHVAGVVVVDAAGHPGGEVTLADIRRLVASRLQRLPRFRQRVSFGLFGLSRPEWVEVAGLDLGAHLFHHRLRAPGGRAQLSAMCARIHANRLPRDRPLWQIHLIDGLDHGRQALIIKTHHAITDGIAGIQLAEVLFDGERPHRRWNGDGLPDLQFGRQGKGRVIELAQAALGLAFTVAGGPLALTGPFNGPVGEHRAFAMATVPTEVITGLKHQLGGSVDDVLLAMVAAGLSRRLARERYPSPPRALRAMLPVSTRQTIGGSALGTHVTAVFVDLPLGTTDLADLVCRIAASKSVVRSSHAAAGMSLLMQAAGRLPRPLQEAAVRFAAALPTSNIVVSDVPGPNEPLYLLGRRIVACYPMIPLPPSVGLSIASVSIGGQMGIGIVADPDLMPRPEWLARDIEAVVMAPAQRQPRRRRTRPMQRRAA